MGRCGGLSLVEAAAHMASAIREQRDEGWSSAHVLFGHI